MNRAFVHVAVLAVVAVAVTACGTTRRTTTTPPQLTATLDAVTFAQLEGWGAGDTRPALTAFLRTCAEFAGRSYDADMGASGYAGKVADWRGVCDEAARVPAADPNSARAFFERAFIPYAVKTTPPSNGLFTGYYEPMLRGSRIQHDQFQHPLYALTPGYEAPRAPRGEIVRNGAGLPVICYVDDKIDAFFLHIQGSGRVVLEDGTVIRAAYAGQNGYPYTAVGAVLLGRGEIPREEMSMQAIRQWMIAHPDEADTLMDMNESYVFFIEKPGGDPALGASGAARVPLTPEASIAVDRGIHPYGVPVWIDATMPSQFTDAAPLHRLYIAQDTGGAIKGPVRADIYWGFGEIAASTAGRMKSQGRMTVLLPPPVASRLGPHARIALP